jgi:antitoxin component YwqK of YwqJK toxin-antitoxin module
VKARHRDGSTAVLFEYPDKEDTLTYIMKTYYSDGKLKRQATVKDGKFTGNIKEYWHNGNMRQLDSLLQPCDIKTQNCNEVLLRYHENGSLAQRFIQTNGVLSGLAEQYDSNGVLKIVYHLKNDSINDGEFIQYYNNGNVAVKATYQMGTMVGEEYFFQVNGDTLRYFQIRDEKPSIPLAKWLENGTVVKGDYINAKRDAVLWKWYDKSGKEIREKIEYRQGGGFVVPK